LLNETIELIVNYTTKSSAVNENSSNEQFSFDLNAVQYADSLIINLEKSKRIIENLNSIDENDLYLIDEKLVEAILNLDFVNKEFKSYLKILEESQLKELESKKSIVNIDNLNNAELLINKNIKIRMLSDQIDELNSRLPKKLFSCKCLPHPTEANQTTSINNIQEESSTNNNNNNNEEIISNIDIKKEIAMSILNVGEIIAKTIDHYSSDVKIIDETLTNTTNNNTEVNEEQKQTNNNELHINVISTNENKDIATTTSTVSSLSSPSVSTSSMSPTEQISPIDKQSTVKQEEEIIDLSKSPKCNNLVEATANLDLIEKFKCSTVNEKLLILY
jgi:hypothetical protein